MKRRRRGPLLLSRLKKMILLSLLFCVCSLPIVTIGASLCGLYSVGLRSRRSVKRGVVQTFFTGFKTTFVQATIAWGVSLAIGLAFYVDIRFWRTHETPVSKPMLAISFVLLAFCLMVLQWLFPLIAKTVDTLPRLVKNAGQKAIEHFIPYTFICTGMALAAACLTFFFRWTLIPMVLFGVDAIIEAQSFFLRRVFEQQIRASLTRRNDYFDIFG